jgi:hypothetical protein
MIMQGLVSSDAFELFEERVGGTLFEGFWLTPKSSDELTLDFSMIDLLLVWFIGSRLSDLMDFLMPDVSMFSILALVELVHILKFITKRSK